MQQKEINIENTNYPLEVFFTRVQISYFVLNKEKQFG